MEFYFVIIIWLLFGIMTVLLAQNKNRSAGVWILNVNILWGIIGFIVLACSDKLDKEKDKEDKLGYGFAIAGIIFWAVLIGTFLYFAPYDI